MTETQKPATHTSAIGNAVPTVGERGVIPDKLIKQPHRKTSDAMQAINVFYRMGRAADIAAIMRERDSACEAIAKKHGGRATGEAGCYMGAEQLERDIELKLPARNVAAAKLALAAALFHIRP
jgi:hypothetical protein